jgi:hypothetical protein
MNPPNLNVVDQLHEGPISHRASVSSLASGLHQEVFDGREVVRDVLANEVDEETCTTFACDEFYLILAQMTELVIQSDFDPDCRPEVAFSEIAIGTALQVIWRVDAKINVPTGTGSTARPLFVNNLGVAMAHRVCGSEHRMAFEYAEQFAVNRMFHAMKVWKLDEVENQLVNRTLHHVNCQPLPSRHLDWQLLRSHWLSSPRLNLNVATGLASEVLDQVLDPRQTEGLQRLVGIAVGWPGADHIVVLPMCVLGTADVNRLLMGCRSLHRFCDR